MRSNRNVGATSSSRAHVDGRAGARARRERRRPRACRHRAENGVPIYLKQIADVRIGDAFRAAALVKGTAEAVGGVVVARYGVSTVAVIERVKQKIAALQSGFRRRPHRPVLRSLGAHRAGRGTLRRALIEETIVVTLVNVLFLLHVRSVLIVTIRCRWPSSRPSCSCDICNQLQHHVAGRHRHRDRVLVDAAIVVTEMPSARSSTAASIRETGRACWRRCSSPRAWLGGPSSSPWSSSSWRSSRSSPDGQEGSSFTRWRSPRRSR